RGLVPEDLSGLLVERDDRPALLAVVVRRIAGAVEADFERRLAVQADAGRDEEPVAPDDRAGVAEAREGGLPADALERPGGRIRVPRHGRIGRRDAARALSPERGPVDGGVVSAQSRRQEEQEPHEAGIIAAR